MQPESERPRSALDRLAPDSPLARLVSRSKREPLRVGRTALLVVAMVLLVAWAWTVVRSQQHPLCTSFSGGCESFDGGVSLLGRIDLLIQSLGGLFPPALVFASALGVGGIADVLDRRS